MTTFKDIAIGRAYRYPGNPLVWIKMKPVRTHPSLKLQNAWTGVYRGFTHCDHVEDDCVVERATLKDFSKQNKKPSK